MKEKVSIKRIAEIAGVSTCTVSKVINNTGEGYSEKTAQKIRAVAKSLNYIPDSAAKMLREAKSYTIGLLMPSLDNDFFASLASYIEKEMRSIGYSVFIASGAGDRECEKQYFRVLAGKGVDGIISCSNLGQIETACRERNIPLINLVRYPQECQVPVVTIDNKQGARTATMHLIEQGCKHILFLGYATAEENRLAREEGYLQALQERNLSIDKNYLVYCPPASDRSSAAGTTLSEFLAAGHPLDGIFAANDSIALGALTFLMRQGFRIPYDIKIIGFDNSIYSSLTCPGISTIDAHADLLAQKSCQLMQSLLQGEPPKGQIHYVPFDLIKRESTAS
ncbi:MAG: LacI family DNA-binding transcriptional regulator [Selenomonas sp.]|nr:LacI family DNA-binding transcriptional regulator [Selenomonas sp.]